MVAGVVMLDVLLLTAILALTGGPTNPFCTLYVVHVVLAVVLLGPIWTWAIVAPVGGLLRHAVHGPHRHRPPRAASRCRRGRATSARGVRSC